MVLRTLAILALVAVVGCGNGTQTTPTHHVTVGGVDRTWTEYQPRHLAPGPHPVVIMFHGLHAVPGDMFSPIGVAAEADRDGFVVALPTGLNRSWNAGSCCGDSTADDVGFVLKMVSSMVARKVADPARIYAAGFSNGGMFSYRLACQMSTALAGVAVVEGTLTAPCPNHSPINLLVIHQLDDRIVPYNGTSAPIPGLGMSEPLPSVSTSVLTFERSEGCVPPTVVARPPKAVFACPGGVRVEVYSVPGGAHVWPPDATTEMATFFGLR